LPELRTSLLLAAGLSWSLAIGAEYLGLQDGLGSILLTAESFTNTGRMMVMALIVILYALISFMLLDRIAGQVLTWMPTLKAQTSVTKLPAAASLGGMVTRDDEQANR
jgi:ABC-type nitrate/sulfonate/bicarbonate transport system permease component